MAPVRSSALGSISALLLLAGGAALANAQSPVQNNEGDGASPTWLGVQVGTDEASTVRVARIDNGSPAEKAGIKIGDLIMAVNGDSPLHYFHVVLTRSGGTTARGSSARAAADRRAPTAVSLHRIGSGDTVRILVRRDGWDREFRVATMRTVPRVQVSDDRMLVGQAFTTQSAPIDPFDLKHIELRTDSTIPMVSKMSIRVSADSVMFMRREFLESARAIGERSGAPITDTSAVVAQRLRAERERAIAANIMSTSFRGVAGAEFVEMTPQLSVSYGGVRNGLLILVVAPKSPAHRATLKQGDIVRGVNGKEVRTVPQLRSAIEAARGSAVLTVIRRNQTMSVTMPLR